MVLHYWPRFQTYLVPFSGVNGQENPKISLKSYFLLLSKYLKLQNSGTTNRINAKLDLDMYHPSTFHLPRNGGVNQWVGWGAYKKSPKNTIKLT